MLLMKIVTLQNCVYYFHSTNRVLVGLKLLLRLKSICVISKDWISTQAHSFGFIDATPGKYSFTYSGLSQ